MWNNYEYKNIIIYLLFCFIISIIIFLISKWIIRPNLYIEKISAYECGFQPFIEKQTNFDIHFYLIAILFIIFDLEIIFLFPWIIVLKYLNFLGFFSMISFSSILTIGFIFEWKKGILDWN